MNKYMILSLLSFPALADNISYKFGLGYDPMGLSGNIANFALGYEKPLGEILDQRLEMGLWTDNLHNGRSSSGYGNYEVGIKVRHEGFYLQTFVGVALINNTDTQLSSVYEFTHDIGFGLMEKSGKAMGLNFKHFSNAGLKKPNIGRNFMQFEVKVPLSLGE